MRSRRRPRRGRYQSRNKYKLNFTPVIVILCLSVGCGYVTAKYVVDPVVNYVPELTAEKEPAAESSSKTEDAATEIIEDDADVVDKGKVTGYALQFGCYTSKTAAEAVVPTIDADGLQVLEQDDLYKIVGEVYETKDEAKAELKKLPDTVNSFVTPIYE